MQELPEEVEKALQQYEDKLKKMMETATVYEKVSKQVNLAVLADMRKDVEATLLGTPAAVFKCILRSELDESRQEAEWAVMDERAAEKRLFKVMAKVLKERG